ncbi:hypothetical protein OT109_13940 [Phycisphaeraceae bacterium D3-23]
MDVMSWAQEVTGVSWVPGDQSPNRETQYGLLQYVLGAHRFLAVAALEVDDYGFAVRLAAAVNDEVLEELATNHEQKRPAIKSLLQRARTHMKRAQNSDLAFASRLESSRLADCLGHALIAGLVQDASEAEGAARSQSLKHLGLALGYATFAQRGFDPLRALEITRDSVGLLARHPDSSDLLDAVGWGINTALIPAHEEAPAIDEEAVPKAATVWSVVRQAVLAALDNQGVEVCSTAFVGSLANLVPMLPQADYDEVLGLCLAAIRRWDTEDEGKNAAYAFYTVWRLCQNIYKEEELDAYRPQAVELMRELVTKAKLLPEKVQLLKMIVGQNGYPIATGFPMLEQIVDSETLKNFFELLKESITEEADAADTPWMVVALRILADRCGIDLIAAAWQATSSAGETIRAYWLEEIAAQAPGEWSRDQLDAHVDALLASYGGSADFADVHNDSRLHRALATLSASANMLDDVDAAGALVEKVRTCEAFGFRELCLAIAMAAPGLAGRHPATLEVWSGLVLDGTQAGRNGQGTPKRDAEIAALTLHTLAIEHSKSGPERAAACYDAVESLLSTTEPER